MTMPGGLCLLTEVSWDGHPVSGERSGALLAALVRAGGRRVGDANLIAQVWEEGAAPVNPVKALQVLVSRTKAQTCPEAIVRDGAGYRVGAIPVDALVRRECLDEAARAADAGDLVTARTAAGEVLGWGVADPDDGPEPLRMLRREAAADSGRARRLLGMARSGLGEHAEALPLLERALSEDPTDPGDEALLAALLRSEAAVRGAAAALERYERHRSRLRETLGVDPGPALQRVYGELLAADRPVRTGLLHDSTPLIGRDQDVAAVTGLLQQARVVSILGAGGLGKTRLAHVVGRAAGTPVVHFVELVGVTSPEDVVGEVGSVLGVRDSVSGRRTLTPEQRADVRARIAQQLDQSPSLLILDNCEHVVEAVAGLVAFLVAATGDLRVLTTTRAPLAIAAERAYPLGELGTTDAVELFRQRAVAARPGVVVDEHVVADVVSRLDGLPLAIELAAAKVRAMSVEDIARRLENRFALLRGGDRSAPDRHQTLLAVIDWSWNLLDEPERRGLRWLSVFHDGFTLEAAEAVLGGDALGAVESLADQSLLGVQDAGPVVRYRMLETVREFGRMQLVDAGEDEEAGRAQRAWAVGYAVAWVDRLFGAGQFAAVDALRAEENNLADVLRRSLAESDRATLVQVLAALGAYWSVLGDHFRVISVAGAAAELLSGWDPPAELHRATRAALVLVLSNALIGAAADAEGVRALLEELGPGEDPQVAGMVTVLLAFFEEEGPDLARPDFQDRLAELSRAPDRHLAIVAGQWLSHARENSGSPEEAVAAAEAALARVTEEDGPWIAAILRTQLAQLQMQLGRVRAAVEHARAALPVLERLDARDDAVQIGALFVLNAVLDGDFAAAERELDRLTALGDSERILGGRMVLQMCRAELQLARGDRAEGLRTYAAGVERIRQVRFPGVPVTGLEPWILFTEAAALTAHALHADGDRLPLGAELFAGCRERALRVLDPAFPHLDYPVSGLLLFGLGAWALQREVAPADQAIRLLVLADRFAYNRSVPSMSWDRIAPLAEERAPGAVAKVRAEYGDRRGPALLEEARTAVRLLPG